eukprot:917223-Pleurochrysis_carterae.AAC.1
MSTLASTFNCHLQLAHNGLVVLFKAFHLLTVKVGVAEHCLREGLDDVDAVQLKVKERNERENDADAACRLSSCRKGLVEMNSRLLTVAAEYPARFASFEGAVVIELVGEYPLGLADKRVLWMLNQVKGIVRYFTLELLDASCAPLFFVRAAVDILLVLGWM